MDKKEFEDIWNLNKNSSFSMGLFDKETIDRILYKYPNSKLVMNPEKLIELSNQSIHKLELFLQQMIITEQIYNHLGVFTIDDKKYHTLGKCFDVELVDDIGVICIIEDNNIHLKIFI